MQIVPNLPPLKNPARAVLILRRVNKNVDLECKAFVVDKVGKMRSGEVSAEGARSGGGGMVYLDNYSLLVEVTKIKTASASREKRWRLWLRAGGMPGGSRANEAQRGAVAVRAGVLLTEAFPLSASGVAGEDGFVERCDAIHPSHMFSEDSWYCFFSFWDQQGSQVTIQTYALNKVF